MAKIRKIYDQTIKPDGSKTTIYPITSTRAVYTPEGETLDSYLKDGYFHGADLRGYKTVSNVTDLPTTENQFGWLIGEDLYVWVGTGGDTLEGLYQNCGHFRTPYVPDDEDLVADSNNELKLKDRTVEDGGMGYVILRKNKTFAEQVTAENTIYEIRYDFDLDSASVTIPSGCVLKFNGGGLNNGTLIGSGTILNGNCKFDNTLLSGSYDGEFYDKWCSSFPDANTFLVNLFACGFRKIVLDADYNVASPHIILGNNVEVEINGTIERTTYSTSTGTNFLFYASGKKNIKICGKGRIKGDKELGAGNHEWHHGFVFVNCQNVTMDSLSICNFWGDGIALNQDTSDNANSNKDFSFRNLDISNVGRNGISLIHADRCTITNCNFHDIEWTTGSILAYAIDIEPNAGTPDNIVEKNILISNCHITNCYGGIMLYGSHARVRNVIIENIEYSNVDLSCLSILYCTNIIARNLTINNDIEKSAELLIQFSNGVNISNVQIIGTDSSYLFSMRGSYNTCISNIAGEINALLSIYGCNSTYFDDCHITTNLTGPAVDTISGQTTTSCQLISFNNCWFNEKVASNNVFLKLGSGSKVRLLDSIFDGYALFDLTAVSDTLIDGCTISCSGLSTDDRVGVASGTYDGIVVQNNTFVLPADGVNYLFELNNGTRQVIVDNIISGTFSQDICYRGDGITALPIIRLITRTYCTSTTRPTLKALEAGTAIFDTSLGTSGKPIWWTGSGWVDATGTVV